MVGELLVDYQKMSIQERFSQNLLQRHRVADAILMVIAWPVLMVFWIGASTWNGIQTVKQAAANRTAAEERDRLKEEIERLKDKLFELED